MLDQLFINKLVKYPKSRLCFITIRCPTQTSKWIKLGKVNDYIRRYSETFYIVKGTKGGTHFHVLAGIEKNKSLQAKKGVHFDFKYFYKKDAVQDYHDYDELRESKERSIHFRKNLFFKLTLTRLTPDQTEKIILINKAVTRYWKSKKQKNEKLNKLKVLDTNIKRVLEYMEKNLSEPRDDDPERFTDYLTHY